MEDDPQQSEVKRHGHNCKDKADADGPDSQLPRQAKLKAAGLDDAYLCWFLIIHFQSENLKLAEDWESSCPLYFEQPQHYKFGRSNE